MSDDTQKEKKRLGLISSYAMCMLALIIPPRLRIIFTFILNFIYNNIVDSVKIVVSIVNSFLVGVIIFLTYFFIVGTCSLIARLSGKRYFSGDSRQPSYFLDKENSSESLEKSSRQY
jgi:uncharacterized protein YqhQ